MSFNPRMVTLARESRGYSQTRLAQESGVSQGFLSKIEHGNTDPGQDTLEKIAAAVRYPTTFFEQELPITGLPLSFFRKKKSGLPQKLVRAAEAAMNIHRLHLSKLLQSAELPELRVPFTDVEQYDGDAAAVARDLRQHWMIPQGPIENVVHLLENSGVIIIEADLDPPQTPVRRSRIDALSLYRSDDGLPPIIIVNPNIPGDRLRFTLCHELAHIVLHHHHHHIPGDEMEPQADDFASEFLMPAKEIRSSLTRLNLPKLAHLKTYWKVAMQALIMRATRLGAISVTRQRTLMIQMSKHNYRIHEPVEIPRERPTLIGELIAFHLDKLSFSRQQLAEALHVFAEEFSARYLRPQLRAVG